MLEDSFVEWLPTRIAVRIPTPVPMSTFDIERPTAEQLLGYFEHLINDLVAFRKHLVDTEGDSELEADYEASEKINAEITEKLGKLISLNFGQSDVTCAIEDERHNKHLKKLTEKVGKSNPGPGLNSAGGSSVEFSEFTNFGFDEDEEEQQGHVQR